MDELREMIEQSGFEHLGVFDASKLVARTEVRDMCSADLCHSYGKSWSCPPACGNLEEHEELFKKYRHGYLFQTVANMEDDFDYEAIEAATNEHARRFNALVDKVIGSSIDTLLLSAGACQLCVSCTYPERPCAHPDKMFPSMEACGLVVGDVCSLAGVRYHHGPRTVAFTSCALYN